MTRDRDELRQMDFTSRDEAPDGATRFLPTRRGFRRENGFHSGSHMWNETNSIGGVSESQLVPVASFAAMRCVGRVHVKLCVSLFFIFWKVATPMASNNSNRFRPEVEALEGRLVLSGGLNTGLTPLPPTYEIPKDLAQK